MKPAATGEKPARDGKIVVSYGRHVVVEDEERRRILCQVSSKKLSVVCGDTVRWQLDDDGEELRGTVLERLPRRSQLMRTDAAGRAEVVVANLTQLVVVFAPEPKPDFFIVDRYIAAAELSGIGVLPVLNKVDAGPEESVAGCRAEMDILRNAGYAGLECSARTELGIAGLAARLTGHSSAFVGQSGVGKSSLANRLMPGLDSATAELSRSTHEGKHTTTASILHHLPSGGELIDSPGVRDFAPAIELLGDPAWGFREIAASAPNCRFKDCRHLKEPACAVQAAVEQETISPRRYESYRRLLRLKEDLAPDPGRRRS